jgi:sugar lactone lactonase YvrE
MAHIAIDPDFRRLIDEHAPVRQAGSGFTFTEGPVWHPTEHFLVFSDMPADVRRRLDRAGVRDAARPSNKANGLTYDAGPEPAGLRARHLLGRALQAGRDTRDTGEPFPGAGAELAQ